MTISALDTYPRLVGDIGGTNARFAVQMSRGAPMSEPLVLRSEEFAGPAEAIKQYLELTGLPTPHWAALAVACPVSGDSVTLTNNDWEFSIRELEATLALDHLRILNDFTALALGLPTLNADELMPIGGGKPVPGKAIGLIGSGTGLGVSGLIPTSQGYMPIEGEGGHVTLPAFNAREAELIALANKRYSHVSGERLISGSGLSIIYALIAEAGGMAHDALQPDEITRRGIAGNCPICRETLDIFCAFLGTLAADLALVLGARGGVYIGGGIVPKLGNYFSSSPFRQRFEEKGRFSSYLAEIPTWVIHAPWPGLIGAINALDDDARKMGIAG